MMRRAQPLLGTLVDISISDDLPPLVLANGFTAAFAAVREVHALMSFHEAGSDIGRFNRAAVGTTVMLNAHTATVLSAALALQEQSCGLFDIRVASRLAAWGLLPRDLHQLIPKWTPQHVAYRFLDAQKIEKLRDDWIDVGGIAKGYAVDLAIDSLHKNGITQALVNAGGDLRVIGAMPTEVNLRDPRQPQRMSQTVSVCNQALATSGSYFSKREVVGTDESVSVNSALINGITGQPIVDQRSVSIIASECMFADALTKIVAADDENEDAGIAATIAWCLAYYDATAIVI